LALKVPCGSETLSITSIIPQNIITTTAFFDGKFNLHKFTTIASTTKWTLGSSSSCEEILPQQMSRLSNASAI